MSSYTQITKHTETGEMVSAHWIDDYFGRHRYGVRFPDGKVFRAEEIEEKDMGAKEPQQCPQALGERVIPPPPPKKKWWNVLTGKRPVVDNKPSDAKVHSSVRVLGGPLDRARVKVIELDSKWACPLHACDDYSFVTWSGMCNKTKLLVHDSVNKAGVINFLLDSYFQEPTNES